MPSSLLAADRAQSVIRTTWSRKPLYMTPFGFSARQNFQLHGSGFNGEVIDPATGHYPLGNGHRTYNPALGRFHRPDSLSPFGRGYLNGYAYCQGDPVNWNDPTGQMRSTVLKGVFGNSNKARFVVQGRSGRVRLKNLGLARDLTVVERPGPVSLAASPAEVRVRNQLSAQIATATIADFRVAAFQVAAFRVAHRIIRMRVTPRRIIGPEFEENGTQPAGAHWVDPTATKPSPPVYATSVLPRPSGLPKRVLMAATGLASGYEQEEDPDDNLAERQLRIRQG